MEGSLLLDETRSGPAGSTRITRRHEREESFGGRAGLVVRQPRKVEPALLGELPRRVAPLPEPLPLELRLGFHPSIIALPLGRGGAQ